jgi:pyrroline-5-carboxylate reductase
MKGGDIDSAVLGFIGTGTITAAIVMGLRAAPGVAQRIYLSPRNAEVARRLSAAHREVRVASSNQAVVDASDIVFLTVRPQIAVDVLESLRFRPDQRIISLIATFSVQQVASLVAPATTITCAVPQPTAAMRLSPTAIFPPDPVVAALFARVGVAFEAATEEEFRALFTTTAAMASFFALLGALDSWLVENHVSAATSHRYLAQMFRGLSEVPLESPLPFAQLAAEFKTRGGLNEQFADELAANAVFSTIGMALNSILVRIVKSEASVSSMRKAARDDMN